MSERQLLETVQAWLRSVELNALDEDQLEQLMITGAVLLDVISAKCRRPWVRILLSTAGGMLREEARDLGGS